MPPTADRAAAHLRSGIRATMYSIWCHYLPRSGLRHVEAPDFERCTQAFEPRTGNGEVEIWIPVD